VTLEVWRGAEYLRPVLVPIDSLEPWPDNPRRGDVAAIAASLDRFGQVRPVLVQGSRIVAGHHLVLAALERGYTHIAVGDHDFGSEDEARAYLLADNRTAELGVVDDALLSAQLAALQDTRGIGYTDKDLAQLESRLAALRAPVAPEPIDLPAEPRSTPGEVYELGPHRLLCGDARDAGALAGLVAGANVEALWTDPPYGVSYVGKTKDSLTIENDGRDGLAALLVAAFNAVDTVLAPSGRFYIAAPAGPQGTVFRNAIIDVGWKLHQVLVWVKDTMVLGHSDYHYAHEDVLYGSKPGPGRVGRGNHEGSRWYGGHDKTTVFQVPRPRRSEQHPTMKPVDLIYRQLVNSTARGDVIMDPFAGSGSTLLAAHQLGLRCMAVELDAGYCDVIRARYADIAGDPSLLP
jgi:DNA modification methylase